VTADEGPSVQIFAVETASKYGLVRGKGYGNKEIAIIEISLVSRSASRLSAGIMGDHDCLLPKRRGDFARRARGQMAGVVVGRCSRDP